MHAGFFCKGIVAGFSIAAPLGPMGALCLSRSIAKGCLSGFISGLGAASAHALFGMAAGFGLTFISSFMLRYQLWIRWAGVIFLTYYGLRVLFSKPADRETEQGRSGYTGDYMSALFLTLTNPITILIYSAAFAGMGMVRTGDTYISTVSLVLGIFTGSSLWWFLLSNGAVFVLRKVQRGSMVWIQRSSGAVILLFALMIFISLFS